MNTPSSYETQAIRAIRAWSNPSRRGWWDNAFEYVNRPLEWAGEAILQAPYVGHAISQAVQGIISLVNDAAQWPVRSEAIYDLFRLAGHPVRMREELFSLDLEAVDRVMAGLDVKYVTLASVEGAATGAVGLTGLVVDIPALVAFNLRAIGEYATYCGFDVSSPEERLFAMHLLGWASSPTDASKAVAMAALVRIAQDVAKKRVWKELEKHAFVVVLQQLAKGVGIRLTKAKLAQAVPATGALIGGGFNAYFTRKVCIAAYYLYRKRFLMQKYPPEALE